MAYQATATAGEGTRAAETKPKKRAAAASASNVAASRPGRLQLTPKQIEDGLVICRLCRAPFEVPDDTEDEEA